MSIYTNMYICIHIHTYVSDLALQGNKFHEDRGCVLSGPEREGNP